MCVWEGGCGGGRGHRIARGKDENKKCLNDFLFYTKVVYILYLFKKKKKTLL